MAVIGGKKTEQHHGYDVILRMELDDLREKVKLLQLRVEALEEAVGEKISEEERRDLKAALEEFKRGETVKLSDALRKLL